MSNAIQNRLPDPDLPSLLAELKLLLAGIDTVSDVVLNHFLLVAMEKADHYCNNDFCDDEGNDLPIPATVKAGVFRMVALFSIKRDPTLRSLSSLGVNKGIRPTEEVFDALNEKYFGNDRIAAAYFGED